MAGYCNFSKSNNALQAEQEGLLPASRAAAALARRHRRLRGLRAADLQAVLAAREWHHTSKFFTAVDYFDLDALARGDLARLYALVRSRRAATPVVHEGCSVRWIDWFGTRRHPRAVECNAAGARVTLTAGRDTVLVEYSGADGTAKVMRKRRGTRGFTVLAGDGRMLV